MLKSGRYLTVYVQAIDAALVNNKLQEQATRIELNSFQLSCLKIAAFVGIKADITHSLEFGTRIGRARVSFNCSANKNFDAGGNLALMREHLQLLNIRHGCELNTNFLRVLAKPRRLPAPGVRSVRVELAGWKIGILSGAVAHLET
jgi:hypothetical protein